MNFPENASKPQESIEAVWGSFLGEKQFLLIFVLFYWFDQKQLLKQIQIFFRICAFSNLLRKTNFQSISVLLLEIVNFWTKREFFSEFPPKCFKTTEKYILAVCGSFWGEKHFCLYLPSFTALNRKSCLQHILIFLWIFAFSNLLRKTNVRIISELLSEIYFFD